MNSIIKKISETSYESPLILSSEKSYEDSYRNDNIIWSSDFSNSNDWVVDHDSNDCSLNFEIGENLQSGGLYPIETIYTDEPYAMIDSDEYGGEQGGNEVEESWLTMSVPLDLSNHDTVVVEFDTWYRSWTYEKCWLVVSTDGDFPDNLTPDSVADPANGIYEIFPGISGEAGASILNNPSTKYIDISDVAAGESEVLVRFNWTGTWGYSWFIDNFSLRTSLCEEYAQGDVNNNGSIDVNDILLTVDMILDKNPSSDKCAEGAADLNKDGRVGLVDVLALVNIVLNSDNDDDTSFSDVL